MSKRLNHNFIPLWSRTGLYRAGSRMAHLTSGASRDAQRYMQTPGSSRGRDSCLAVVAERCVMSGLMFCVMGGSFVHGPPTCRDESLVSLYVRTQTSLILRVLGGLRASFAGGRSGVSSSRNSIPKLVCCNYCRPLVFPRSNAAGALPDTD